MKPVAASGWLLIAIPALVLAFGLAGCGFFAPRRYIPPPLPAAPAAPKLPPQVNRPVFYVKADHLNLRACPGMDCPKVSLLERNEEVEKVGASEDWVQIRVKRDGRLGWVDSRYLSPTQVAAPEAAPPAPPVEETSPPLPERIQPPPLPQRIQPPPLPERIQPPPERPVPALAPVEKVKPVKPEEAVPPAKQKPEEAKPAKPAKAKPAETGGAAPKKAEKPAPKKEEKPATPPAETPEPGQKVRIM